jgi:hypothetical protein
MKTTIKREALEINAVIDQDTDELELQYSSATQKQFAKTLQLVKSIENQLCPTTDEIEREQFEETLKNLSDLGLGQEVQLQVDEVPEIIGLLALAILERKKLHKPLGPLRSTMQALAVLPCVPLLPGDIPPTNRIFSPKGRNRNLREKVRAAAPANSRYMSTVDAHQLYRATKKRKRLGPQLKNLQNVLSGFAVMYDLALAASKPTRK